MKRCIACLSVAVGVAACGDGDPAAPAFPQEPAQDVVAQSRPAEATFVITVTADGAPCAVDGSGLDFTCPANVDEVLLSIRVLGAFGPVDRGDIVFYLCDGAGIGSQSSCATGDTKWRKLIRLNVGEDGTSNVGWILRGLPFLPQTVTWKYFGQGSGLSNTEGPVVAITQAEPGS